MDNHSFMIPPLTNKKTNPATTSRIGLFLVNLCFFLLLFASQLSASRVNIRAML